MTIEKVSIVLPTYNGGKYLRQSIESCLNQSYKNIEVIVVDDGSIDDTQEIIKSFNDRRLIGIKNETNLGIPSSLNKGFRATDGEYLTWTSCDNYYDTCAIETMLTFIKENQVQFVFSDYYKIVNEDVGNRVIINGPKEPDIARYCFIGPCFLYSRDVKIWIGDYDLRWGLVCDYDYWIRVAAEFNIGYINEPLYFYRVHEAAISSTKYFDMMIDSIILRLDHNLIDVEKASELLLVELSGNFLGYKKTITNANNLLSSGKLKPLVSIVRYMVSKVYRFYRFIHYIFLTITLKETIKHYLHPYSIYHSRYARKGFDRKIATQLKILFGVD